ncbi:hypothetical protein VTL71DRAFT_13777 [Oculimacula yallundae]|uniref:Uncharacterized protein n=1 Tax=Oculimacula yallundae TaxID=86028 RepID=A0ABR4CLC9_9HELO
MAQNRPPLAIYDFTPFFNAPGVAAEVRHYGAPQIVDIPQTAIPSPLAPDLAPNTVESLRERLVGNGSSAGHVKGDEVWASWKRAWDLWNNHYIEGRVAPLWIKEEYERLKKEMGKVRDKRRSDEQMQRSRTRRRPGRVHTVGPATVFSMAQPEAAPGKYYRQTTETRPTGMVLVKEKQPRPKAGKKLVYKRKGEVYQEYPDRFVTEIVQVERVVPKKTTPIRSWADVIATTQAKLPLPEGSDEPEPPETVIEHTLEERQKMRFGTIDVYGDKISPNLMSYEEVNQYVDTHGALPEVAVTDPPTFISQRPEMWYPETEPSLGEMKIMAEDGTVVVHEFEDIEVDTLKEGDGVLLGWVEEDLSVGDMDIDDDVNEDFRNLPVADEEPAVAYKRADLVERDDGLSGGFFPMKLLDEYPEPDETEEDDAESDWLDAIQNTVWRPRHVGEKTLRIEIDEPFKPVTATKNCLEVDGGVDCGRSPYPVLRSVTEYFKVSQSTGNHPDIFRKKKMWDGVTGTIFNMPTKPLEDDETEDDRLSRMKALYGDFFRDEAKKHRNDCFPLDIRRVKRQTNSNYPARQFTTPVLESNETLVRYPWHIPEGDERNGCDPLGSYDDSGKPLSPYDPYAVTSEQREKRDIPTRRYPPAHCDKAEGHQDLLPVDDSIWREELEDDDYGRWKYYVTNLHGGTLLINGKEVKRNQIAGPLPEFAVIETPGGQVSFWWGPNGRNHMAGSPGVSHEAGWRSLRSRDIEFRTIALTAGQEWDFKIRERITKEFSGNEWEDDEEWEEWKKAVAVPEVDSKGDSSQPGSFDFAPITLTKYKHDGVPAGTNVVQPEWFPTDQDELMWLHTTAEPLSRVIEAAKTSNFIEPIDAATGFFPGAGQPSVRPEIVAQQQAIGVWSARLPEITREQQKLIGRVVKAKANKAERERQANVEIGKKRAAESALEGPFPKRTMPELVHEREEAAKDLKKLEEEQANQRKDNVRQPMVPSVRLFDTAIRSCLQQNFAAYKVKKITTLVAGRPFTESPPTLEGAIEQHLKETRKKEQRDMSQLQQRAVQGHLPYSSADLPPGVDAVYAQWKTYKFRLEKSKANPVADKDKITAILKSLNASVEAQRLKELQASQDELARQTAAEQKKAEESEAAFANLTPAEKARNSRKAAFMRRGQVFVDEKSAELLAATDTGLQASTPAPNQPLFVQMASKITTTTSTGKKVPAHAVQPIKTKPKPTSINPQPSQEKHTSTGPKPSDETQREQLAIEADIDATNLAIKKADLEENIALRAQTCGLTIRNFILDQGYASKEQYINAMLKSKSDFLPPIPSTAFTSSTPAVPIVSSAPAVGPKGAKLIQTKPLPRDRFISDAVTKRLQQYRDSMRAALQRDLQRQALIQGKTQLDIVRGKGYQDIDAYLSNLSNAIRPEEVDDDVLILKNLDYPERLPKNASQDQIMERDALIDNLAAKAIAEDKRFAVRQRLQNAEDFEAAAQYLERNPPPRVNIRTTVPGGTPNSSLPRKERDL